jgi:hypothetical protein
MKKVIEIKVWGNGRKGLWSYGNTIDIPASYVEISLGNAFLTRKIKECSKTVYISMVKDGSYSVPQSLWASKKIVEKVKKLEEETRAVRQNKRLQAQQSYEKKVLAVISNIFPRMPEGDKEDILDSFDVGSGTVGRSSTLDLEEKINKAVWAHIRHTHTQYDELMRDEMDRIADDTQGWDYDDRREEFENKKYEIREWVRPEIQKKFDEWKKT